MDAGQVTVRTVSGLSGHAVSLGPMAALSRSHGRHTADLCQRLCRPAPRWPARLWRWWFASSGRPSQSGLRRPQEHPDQPLIVTAQGEAWSMACLTGRVRSQITSRFVARAWPGGGGGPSHGPANAWLSVATLGPGRWGLVKPASLAGSNHYGIHDGALVARAEATTGDLTWAQADEKKSRTS